jgi:hypothetical protein
VETGCTDPRCAVALGDGHFCGETRWPFGTVGSAVGSPRWLRHFPCSLGPDVPKVSFWVEKGVRCAGCGHAKLWPLLPAGDLGEKVRFLGHFCCSSFGYGFMSQGTGKSVPEMTPQKCMTPQGLLRTLKADFFLFLLRRSFWYLVHSKDRLGAHSPTSVKSLDPGPSV